MSGEKSKVRLAVFKLTSCSGCQQQIIDLGDQLLALLDRIEIAYFLDASSDAKPGPYDVALVEGSVSTPHEEELVKRIRENSRMVVSVGSCATYGGIQALRNWMDFEEVKKAVYEKPELIEALEKSRPVSDFIEVDYAIGGCPANKLQLLSVLKQVLIGRRVYQRGESLCQECKRKGNVCVVVAKGQPCLGPITREGCGALCPSYERGCYGCFGPMVDPQPGALARRFEDLGLSREEAALRIRSITSWSEPIRRFLEKYER